ncbi:MAG: zf-HC2 domain-containing protein [Actinobacteria bacterium]|nr:zf-HC2 domain-containing protein [Actinomycetota bacterium]
MAIRESPPSSAALPISCATVRDRLPDHVLGALAEQEERELVKHLEWCAGCRKELAELEEGVAAVGLALEPIAPPVELERKVLQRVSEAAGATARERRRFRIVTAIAVLATFLAIIAFSYAAIVAGRFERYLNETRAANERAAQLEKVFPKGQEILPARLSPMEGYSGGGQAIVALSPEESQDWVLVIVGGLTAGDGPYSASLVHGSGIEVPVGELRPARPGQLSAYRFFRQDLTGFRTVIVTDQLGRVVLRGPILGAG